MDATNLAPLLSSVAQVAGAAILGLWTTYSHKLKVTDADRNLMDTAIHNAVTWAETEVGDLSKEHLTMPSLKNQFLQKGLEYVETHVPDAVKRLGLDNVEVEEKLIVALAHRLTYYVAEKPAESAPVPAAVS